MLSPSMGPQAGELLEDGLILALDVMLRPATNGSIFSIPAIGPHRDFVS